MPLLLSWQRDEIATHASMSEVEAKASTFRSTDAELFSSHSFTFPSGEVDLRLVRTEEVVGKLFKKKESKSSSNHSVGSTSLNGNNNEAMNGDDEGNGNGEPPESFEDVVAKVKKIKEDVKAARKKRNWKDVYNGMKVRGRQRVGLEGEFFLILEKELFVILSLSIVHSNTYKISVCVCVTLQALKKVDGINYSVLEATGIGKSQCEKTQTDACVHILNCVSTVAC